jgi:cell wall-associated NlpC family hydrolase
MAERESAAMTELEQQQRAAVVAEAESWLRTPYVHAQRVKGAGVDCAMLPAEVYHGAGLLPFVAVPYYPRDWHHNVAAERYLAIVLSYTTEIPRAALTPGDLILFRIGKCWAHGGIVMPPGWPRIIHSDANAGCVAYGRADGGRLADPRCKPRYFTLWPSSVPARPSQDAGVAEDSRAGFAGRAGED